MMRGNLALVTRSAYQGSRISLRKFGQLMMGFPTLLCLPSFDKCQIKLDF